MRISLVFGQTYSVGNKTVKGEPCLAFERSH